MGAIMLDFEWNSRVAQNGYVELGKPVYDKKLWLEGAWNIEPPTVRGVVDIGMTIVSKAVNAAVTGVVGGADFGVLGSLAGSAVGLLDDLLFAGADVSGGYKSASEVGDELAKKSIAAAVNVGLGTLGAGIGSAVEGLGGVVGVLSEIGIAGGSSAITTVTDTALGAMDFTNIGNADFFNTEMFTSQMGSVSTWGSTVSSMVTAGVSGGMGLLNLQDVQGFSSTNIGDIGTLNSFVGGIAGSAVTYAMTDSVTFNLANYKGVGLFELTYSKDGGFSSRLGMGGQDISLGTIASAMQGAGHWNTNNKIQNYVSENGLDKGDFLRMNYGFGDDKAKDQLDSILEGSTLLEFGGTDGKAQTVLEGDKRVVHLNGYKEGMSLEESAELALLLGHEGHRDGVVSGDNALETRSAVTAHSAMALRMIEDKRYINTMMGVLGNNSNLQNDVMAYLSGNMDGYIDANYDSSGDYWKLKMNADGSHEIVYDGKEELTIEYRNADGKEISTMNPAGQNMSDVGMAEALGKILGLDGASALLGSDLSNADLYDTQTLKDVLNLSDTEIAQIQRSGTLDGIALTEAQKYSLAGEALMKNGGASWTAGWQNTGELSFELPYAYDGNIMAEVVDGKYLYSTVNATVYRDPDSLKGFIGTQDKNGDIHWPDTATNTRLDTIVYEKIGINTDIHDVYPVSGYQTVDNMVTNSSGENLNQEYYIFGLGWAQGNTMNSGYNMEYISTSGSYAGNVLVINNGFTIDGRFVNSEGVTSDSNLRYLGHANRAQGGIQDWNTYRSDGCNINSYDNQVLLFQKFDEWNLRNGYQISTTLYKGFGW